MHSVASYVKTNAMREMIFISHANPEDNEFTRWLALQLAREGYPVWCDLTKLLGGEVFWENAEEALRDRTAKFLYVLSKTSNEKPGVRNELAVAAAVKRKEKLKDFIIPLAIDSLAPADFNIEIARINAISFRERWPAGFATLVAKLEKDDVKKKAQFGPAAVSSWWRQFADASGGLKEKPETLITNWYPLEPTSLFFHALEQTGELRSEDVESEPAYPAVRFNQYLVSFAPGEDFAGRYRFDTRIQRSITSIINPSTNQNSTHRLWSFRDERSTLATLLRLAWDRLLLEKGLSSYSFANGRKGLYFIKGQVPDDRISFIDANGAKTWRDVIGYKTLKNSDGEAKGMRHWHFCLEARPTSHPVIGFTMRPHVVFSDDGLAIWDSADRMHRARRSQCKGWWNDKWRGLIGATVSWLSSGDSTIKIKVGSNTTLRIAATPIRIESPVSYDEPEDLVIDDVIDTDQGETEIDQEFDDMDGDR